MSYGFPKIIDMYEHVKMMREYDTLRTLTLTDKQDGPDPSDNICRRLSRKRLRCFSNSELAAVTIICARQFHRQEAFHAVVD